MQPPSINKILIAYHRFPPIAEDLKKAFLRQGIQVEVFYTTDYEHWFYRRVIKSINRYARNFRLIQKGEDVFKTHPLNLVNYVRRNFEQAFSLHQPDAVFVIHGLPFGSSCISPITVPKIAWHIEPRDDLPYLKENANAFDIYNSYSQKDVDLLTGTGIDCRYLSHAVDPEKFYSVAGAEKIFDLTFVGNWSSWRDEAVQAALEVTDNVALYGGYWQKKSSIPRKVLRQIFKGNEITGANLNRLYCTSKVVLNASRIPGSHGLNMRFFEVLATGSVLLTDTVPELEKHFVPNSHLLRYQSISELKQLLSHLLNNPQEQEQIGLAGRELVFEKNCYDSMAKHLLNQFEEILLTK